MFRHLFRKISNYPHQGSRSVLSTFNVSRHPTVFKYLAAPLGVNFINILLTNFSYEHRFGSFFYVHVTREKLPKQRLYKKRGRIMLMKLTASCLNKY